MQLGGGTPTRKPMLFPCAACQRDARCWRLFIPYPTIIYVDDTIVFMIECCAAPYSVAELHIMPDLIPSTPAYIIRPDEFPCHAIPSNSPCCDGSGRSYHYLPTSLWSYLNELSAGLCRRRLNACDAVTVC